MAKFCTECGKEIAAGVAFCTECGAKAPADNNTEKKEVKQEAAPATRTCKKCGAELKEGVAFCTECGASSKDESADATTAEVKTEAPPPPAQEPRQQPTYHQPQPTYQQQPQPTYAAPPPAPKDESGGVVSTGTFFGTMLLFALPFIGFIACIIMCFAPKRKSLKNYAKANLIWEIIGLVFGILLIVAVIVLGGSLMDYLSEAMGG